MVWMQKDHSQQPLNFNEKAKNNNMNFGACCGMFRLLPNPWNATQVDVPTHVDASGSLRDELALRIMRKITPGITYSEAWKALTHGYCDSFSRHGPRPVVGGNFHGRSKRH